MNSKSHANGHSKSESVTLINIILRLPSVSPFFRKEYSIYTKTDEGDWPKTFNGMTQTFDDTCMGGGNFTKTSGSDTPRDLKSLHSWENKWSLVFYIHFNNFEVVACRTVSPCKLGGRLDNTTFWRRGAKRRAARTWFHAGVHAIC